MTDSGSWMKLVSLRKPFHHHKIPFVVCWSQKAGCTTVFKWFLFHAGMLDEALAYIPQNPGKVRSIHKYEIEVFKARPGYTEELAEKLHGKYPVINFLRCPYERAFSSYMHIHNPKYIVYPNWKTPGLEMRHKILEDVYGDNFCTEYPLSFLDYLLWLKTQDMETLDPHHRPQYNPLFDAVPVNHFRLEDFAEAVSFLEKKYALASSLKSNAGILASGHHVDKQAMSKKSTLEFLNRGMPLSRSERFRAPGVTRNILEGTEPGALVEQLFSQDIDLYDQIR